MAVYFVWNCYIRSFLIILHIKDLGQITEIFIYSKCFCSIMVRFCLRLVCQCTPLSSHKIWKKHFCWSFRVLDLFKRDQSLLVFLYDPFQIHVSVGLNFEHWHFWSMKHRNRPILSFCKWGKTVIQVNACKVYATADGKARWITGSG